jgi:signal transduction histidine kinase
VTDFWQRLKRRRLGGVAGTFVRLLDRLVALLEIPSPEAEQVFWRITKMERDIFLPLKAAGIGMLLYSFHHGWIKSTLDELSIAVEWTSYFLWYYVPANIVFAIALLAMRRLPLGLVQWMVFVSGLLDVVLLSALTVLTLDYQSYLYWLFLALIIRSAVSVPRATSQLVLHFTIILCCTITSVMQISINSSLYEKLRAELAVRKLTASGAGLTNRPPTFTSRNTRTNLDRPSLAISNAPLTLEISNTIAASPLNVVSNPASLTLEPTRPRHDMSWLANENDNSKDALLLAGPLERPSEAMLTRLALLVLMSVCSYGVQVLFERQRKAEEEAREFAMREGQLHAAGRLAAEFAHQVKNPLAIINNASFSLQRALTQGRTPPADQVQIIHEEVEHASRIITQIMGYAQLSEGRVEKLDVVEELDRAIRQVFPPAANYPVEIQRDYGGEFPPLLMQRRHAAESFANILQNARDAFDGHGGKIAIQARCRPDYTIEVSIRDNGPGIPPDKQERIFEAYYTTKEKGTGLGLATVKHNVELYGGSVRVESALGEGACFILLFPGRTQIRPIKSK